MQLVWFKRDLRTADNKALAEAATRGPVLPLYIRGLVFIVNFVNTVVATDRGLTFILELVVSSVLLIIVVGY